MSTENEICERFRHEYATGGWDTVIGLIRRCRADVHSRYAPLVEAAKEMRDAHGLCDQARALEKLDAALDALGVT